MAKAENEYFHTANGGTSESFSAPEDCIAPPVRHAPQESPPLRQRELLSQPETSISVKVLLPKENQGDFPPSLEQKDVKDWLMREIREADDRLTEYERRKIRTGLRLWRDHAIISLVVGLPVGALSVYLCAARGNKIYSLINFLPSALKLATILASEKKHALKFDPLIKGLYCWPTSPTGYAMPFEIATILGKNQALKAYLTERFIPKTLRNTLKSCRNFLRRFKSDTEVTSPKV